MSTLVRASNPQPPVEILSSTPAPSIHSGYISKQTSTAPKHNKPLHKIQQKTAQHPNRTHAHKTEQKQNNKKNTEAEQQNKRAETKLTQF